MKIPAWVFTADVGEIFVKRVGAPFGNNGFFKHGEFHAVRGSAECLYGVFGAGFLVAEIVGWKTEYHQSIILVPFVERFQTIILVGVTTFTGGIYHDQYFAGVLFTEVNGFVLGELKFR